MNLNAYISSNSCQIQYLKSLEDSKMQDFSKNDSKTNGRWTREEHLKFLEGLRIYGKNWKKIQQLVQTRSGSQIRSHAQKFFLKLKQGGKSEHSEHTQNSGDLQGDPQEPNVHSKVVSQTGVQEQDFSYFLMKIVEYNNSKHCLNFWTDLVDCKKESLQVGKTQKYHSFLTIGGEYSMRRWCGLFNK